MKKTPMRTQTIKKLAVTRPEYAAAARAQRAEQFLDDRIEARTNNYNNNRDSSPQSVRSSRPKSAPGTGRSSSSKSKSKSSKGGGMEINASTGFAMNPAEKGIPDGGNWKSVGKYNCPEGPSMLAAPWATHFQVYERFPATQRTERTKKTIMLQTKYDSIKAQLMEVEEELEERRRERVELGSARQKGGGKPVPRPQPQQPKKKTKTNMNMNMNTTKKNLKSTLYKKKTAVGKSDFTVSHSARDFINNL